MVSTADFKNGLVFEWDNRIWQVVWFQHHKPGKGGAVMRCKIRNMKTGDIIERTFKSGEEFREVETTRRKKNFSYIDGDKVHFMDDENYEELALTREQLGDSFGFLKEGMSVDAVYLDGEFLTIQLPASVIMKVVTTMPGVRGNTVTNATKPATLETGIEVQVPLFINEGDDVKVDTRTHEYVERA